jgi:hypothetical protein
VKDKQPCGCVHDGTRWLKLCAEHEAETRELHERAAADHQQGERLAQCSLCGAVLPLSPDGKLPFHGILGGGHCAASETKPSDTPGVAPCSN